MNFLWWFKKKETKPMAEVKPREDIATLIARYKIEKCLLSPLAVEYMGDIPERFMETLHDTERQIIEILPDDFQRNVFEILARRKFDITEFLESESWEDIFREVCHDICYFLYYGSPYPIKPEWKPLPFTGQEFFFWLLSQAKSGRDKDLVINILAALKDAYAAREILGRKFTENEMDSIVSRVLTVFMSGEFGHKSRVLIDILCELEGGESFIRGQLLGLEVKHTV